jgi:predicted nucleic acid-binding protein
MSAVFADTFYWVALTNVQDAEHERAKEFSRTVRPSAIVTTEYVLTEYLNYFAAWGAYFRLRLGMSKPSLPVRQ